MPQAAAEKPAKPTLNPDALAPMHHVLRRLSIHPEVLLVLLHNPELDDQLMAALRLAEGK